MSDGRQFLHPQKHCLAPWMALGRLDAMPTASVAAHKTTVEANARALTEREGDRPAIDENIFNLVCTPS